MAWQIEFDRDALKDLRKLDKPIQVRLVGFLRTRISTLSNPRDLGEALSGQKLSSCWWYRVADWRIICDIHGTIALWCASCVSAIDARSIGKTHP